MRKRDRMGSLLEDLRNPEALPDPTDEVTLVQTHISMIFIGKEYVYKVKKPVDFGFLDFSTVEKRLFYCTREVELNRRFSNDLYVGVLPVFFDGMRYSMKKGKGEPADYAVKMRRIPEDTLMDAVFERGEIKNPDLEEIASFLARFHATAEGGPEISMYGEPSVFKVNTDENFAQVEPYIGITIERDLFRRLRDWTDKFFETKAHLFAERIANRRIRDCHGDLHMQHICLTRPVQAFDCIEFNDRFRYGDTLSDIAFLLMDMEYRGAKDEAAFLWESYRRAAGEEGGDELLSFYKVYRAFVRGKVIGFTVNDTAIEPSLRRRAAETAARYFSLAGSFIS
jgi:aminoglycoside phosphotransferase family enzyme